MNDQNTQTEIDNDRAQELTAAKLKAIAESDMVEVRLQVERACRQTSIGKPVAFDEIIEHAVSDEKVKAFFFRLLTNTDGDAYNEIKALKKHLHELALSTAFYQVVDALEHDWATWEWLRDTHAER
jgi:t-SNARE complex subunit (syntaxin)